MRARDLESGESYWGDRAEFQLSLRDYKQPDFKREWCYMPQIQIVDKEEMLMLYGVFLMMFVFIVIVCLIAAMVIAYIRCLTISINNRYVFEDLKRLGASPTFLAKEVKRQSSKIFLVPTVIGMSAMYLLMALILGMNDGFLNYSGSEINGLGVCALLLAVMAGLMVCIYQMTVKRMKKELI